ncbi:Uncharacterized conserved protein [Listeria grayi]|uniref:IDEAL domain protein n=3 Tax=Listeria grayi TaxID=1641 RepID=D7UZM2_LISGR|nr:IDEAL domain-containing protein [Listeria grayi]EFI82867.1 IDEAL domain protein [Listeria grayi DSM 20601]EUJ25664.1 hypothetical protein LMUR_14871 [Listeria grayi FSL F6-1183]MBC1921431.1 IDEAL domain-containing protein [Listeria grayi]STY44157.1 Uncharacterized conserved protein [Listeria grayi]VEI35842.1 Uncharacterized conserved protein [Listeria grayi]
MEMRDFSNSLMNQVGVLKGEKELTNVFIEYYMTMLLEERRIELLRENIDAALDKRDSDTFFQLSGELNQLLDKQLHI